MPRFVKRPIEIEARQYIYSNTIELCDWMLSYGIHAVRWSDSNDLGISTLEGIMHASVGDWIIRGIRNEFYPCKPDVFAGTYEEVGSCGSGKPSGPTLPPTSSGESPACTSCTGDSNLTTAA